MNTAVRAMIAFTAILSLSFGSTLLVQAETIITWPAPKAEKQPTKRPPLVDGFRINMIDGTATPAKAKEGTTVSVQAATAKEGMIFTCFTSDSDLEFEDPNTTVTTFVMKDHEVEIQAHYKEIVPSGTSSNVISSSSHKGNFSMAKETLSTRIDKNGSTIAALNLTAAMGKNGSVRAKIVEADLNACVAMGKEAKEKSKSTFDLQIEVKLPVAIQYTQIVMDMPLGIWKTMLDADVAKFTIASKEAAFSFNKAAITAMATQTKEDSRLVFDNNNPSSLSDHTFYKFRILYKSEKGVPEDIDKFVMPTSGIDVTVSYVPLDEKEISKISVYGFDDKGISQKASGASYSTKLRAVLFSIGSYKYYSVGI